MFKKRTRPSSIRSKDTAPSLPASSTAALPSTSSSATSPLPSESTLTDAHNSADLPTPTSAAVPTEEEDEPSVGATIQDLLSLRRLRRQAEGLDLEKLNRGEVRKRKKKAVAAEGEEEAEEEGEGGEEQSQVGLRAGKGKGREEIDEGDTDAARMKRLMKASNFTQQTNALDVDKHMMAYIEAELAKRRGTNPASSSDPKPSEQPQQAAAFVDPQEELYAIAEQYRNEQREKAKGEDDDGGNVMNSMAMLTAIPEVDLGMDNRLKNIEDTEKAKRLMLEARKKQQLPTEAENDFAAARFYRPNQRLQSDHDALMQAKREAQGLPPLPSKQTKRQNGGGGAGGKPEMATDDVVMERFKKRMRK